MTDVWCDEKSCAWNNGEGKCSSDEIETGRYAEDRGKPLVKCFTYTNKSEEA